MSAATPEMHVAGGGEGESCRRDAEPLERVASFPPVLAVNPYQRLLYRAMADSGIVLDDAPGPFTARWLRSARGRVRYLHFHWQEIHYRTRKRGLGRSLWWAKLPAFAARLAFARLLGYRIVWTIHQVAPHESSGRALDRLGGALLARASHVLIAHDRATARAAERSFRLCHGRVSVVPHGSYVGVYPAGRPRDLVRDELGVSPETTVFLCFGGVRAYKDLGILLEAFARVSRTDVALVVAGLVSEEAEAERVRAAARRDPRVHALLERIPEERVAELFGASDAAVLARGDGGTSGALVLALSMGRPCIAAATANYLELLDGGLLGWTFVPGDAASLARVIDAAAADPEGGRRKGEAALARARALDWGPIGRRTAALMRGDRRCGAA